MRWVPVESPTINLSHFDEFLDIRVVLFKSKIFSKKLFIVFSLTVNESWPSIDQVSPLKDNDIESLSSWISIPKISSLSILKT